ncbi:MAG: hypothetical protein AMS17_08400 [Spirochaetes bacterium DG_61]|nr:MAG: hypothetical protein AMS17_08400 [Spirochaetes bacterium DG_61]
MLRGFIRRISPLSILSSEELERIHAETLEVLERTGVSFLHQKALELMKANGCKVDFNSKRIRIPGWLV